MKISLRHKYFFRYNFRFLSFLNENIINLYELYDVNFLFSFNHGNKQFSSGTNLKLKSQ